jgi:hypothetical protein
MWVPAFFLIFFTMANARADTSFDVYFPRDQYPSMVENTSPFHQESQENATLAGDIKNLSQEIQRSVKDVAQKRNLTCLGDPCLLQFFPLAYSKPDSGFFGGLRVNLTNISRLNPYFYNSHIQIIRSDTDQWLSAFQLDIPEVNLKAFSPRLKLRGVYARSTEFRYTGEGAASKNENLRPDAEKRYSLNEKSAGATLLIPFKLYTETRFGLYSTYDYASVRNGPFVSEQSILFENKPYAFEGGIFRSLGFGIYYDTRNSETLTRSGEMFELGAAVGALDREGQVSYRINLIDRRYYSVKRWTLAHRLTLDGLFGKVPFWQKTSIGGIDPIRDVSGSGLLKGYAGGRFHEQYKILESLELRLHQNEYRALGQRGDLVLIPVAFEMGILSRLFVWSFSTGVDLLWNKSFLTRFYASYAEGDTSLSLKFSQEF